MFIMARLVLSLSSRRTWMVSPRAKGALAPRFWSGWFCTQFQLQIPTRRCCNIADVLGVPKHDYRTSMFKKVLSGRRAPCPPGSGPAGSAHPSGVSGMCDVVQAWLALLCKLCLA